MEINESFFFPTDVKSTLRFEIPRVCVIFTVDFEEPTSFPLIP